MRTGEQMRPPRVARIGRETSEAFHFPPPEDNVEVQVDSFAKARSLHQGILLIVVCCVGILGFAAQVEDGNVPMAVMFGVVTPLGFALGIWLIRRALVDRGLSSPDPSAASRKIDA